MVDEQDDLEVLDERDETVTDELDEEEELPPDPEDVPTNYQDNIDDEEEPTPAPVKVLKAPPKKKAVKKKAVALLKETKRLAKKAVKTGKLITKVVKEKPKKKVIKKVVKKEKKETKAKKVKKEKREKGKKTTPQKRGPKGAQWTRWSTPFQPSSTLAQLFSDLSSRGGIKHKEFVKRTKKLGGSPTWVLGIYKKEQRRGWTWSFDDSHGRYRITDVEVNRKSHGKWW